MLVRELVWDSERVLVPESEEDREGMLDPVDESDSAEERLSDGEELVDLELKGDQESMLAEELAVCPLTDATPVEVGASLRLIL